MQFEVASYTHIKEPYTSIKTSTKIKQKQNTKNSITQRHLSQHISSVHGIGPFKYTSEETLQDP